MILNIMICTQCDDKWFMDESYEHTNPETSHCENCGNEGRTIRFIRIEIYE